MNLRKFLGADKLAELNAQRMPEHWPMAEGPTWYENLVVDNLVDLGLTEERAIEGMTKNWELEEEDG